MDDGAIATRSSTRTATSSPQTTHVHLGWGGDVDPNFILSIFTTDRSATGVTVAWSNPEYDKLFLQQESTIDVQKRIELVHQMQQIVYQDTPYICWPIRTTSRPTTTRSDRLGACQQQQGAVWYKHQPDTYLAVHEVSSVVLQQAPHRLIAGIVAAVAIIIIIVVLLVRRVARTRRWRADRRVSRSIL